VSAPPVFDDAFRAQLEALIAWRRDVRRFRRAPVDRALVDRLLDLAQLAPSVGNSFARCNADALAALEGERAQVYARLKLEGLEAAPVQLAVFCDHATAQGHGLGCRTMPEALDHSVAAMVGTLWLAARAQGLGVGWVSILDAGDIARALDVDPGWRLIAYLCLGWPEEEHLDPELERHGWQARNAASRTLLKR
jgi:5,6-dimethylbenzimidazole synthase